MPESRTLYWVSPTASTWNAPANWSLSSGGASGAGVPGVDDTAILDGGGLGNCTLDVDLGSITDHGGGSYTIVPGLASIDLRSGYTGTFSADGHAFVCPAITQAAGTFNCGASTIALTHLVWSGGTWTRGTSTLVFYSEATSDVATGLTIHDMAVVDSLTIIRGALSTGHAFTGWGPVTTPATLYFSGTIANHGGIATLGKARVYAYKCSQISGGDYGNLLFTTDSGVDTTTILVPNAHGDSVRATRVQYRTTIAPTDLVVDGETHGVAIECSGDVWPEAIYPGSTIEHRGLLRLTGTADQSIDLGGLTTPPTLAAEKLAGEVAVTGAGTVTLGGDFQVGQLELSAMNAATLDLNGWDATLLDAGAAINGGGVRVPAGSVFSAPADVTIADLASIEVTGDGYVRLGGAIYRAGTYPGEATLYYSDQFLPTACGLLNLYLGEIMMERNAATPPPIRATVVKADGGAITSGVAVYHTDPAGNRVAGGGALSHLTGGRWTYTPTRAETDHTTFELHFSHPAAYGGGPTVQVFTGVDPAAIALEATADAGRTAILEAIAENIVSGSGAIPSTIICSDGTGAPLDGVEVWITTDSDGANVVAGTKTTDAFGCVAFMLDAGPYYVWRQRAGYNFTNPQTLEVAE